MKVRLKSKTTTQNTSRVVTTTRAMSTSAVKKLADDARLCARKTREGKMEKLEKLKREKEEREQRRERMERSTRVHAGTSGKKESERTPSGTKRTPRNDAEASARTKRSSIKKKRKSPNTTLVVEQRKRRMTNTATSPNRWEAYYKRRYLEDD